MTVAASHHFSSELPRPPLSPLFPYTTLSDLALYQLVEDRIEVARSEQDAADALTRELEAKLAGHQADDEVNDDNDDCDDEDREDNEDDVTDGSDESDGYELIDAEPVSQGDDDEKVIKKDWAWGAKLNPDESDESDGF